MHNSQVDKLTNKTNAKSSHFSKVKQNKNKNKTIKQILNENNIERGQLWWW